MASAYYNNMIRRVLEASRSDCWEEAVYEWDIVDYEEDDDCESVCICGKQGIRYLYTIRNKETGKQLYPIGSSCIKRFEREDMDEEIAVLEGMFKLYRALRNREKIELSTEYFTKRLLRALYDEGAFQDNQYNRFDGWNDYDFMLKMFNKRDKTLITEPQHRKIGGLIAYSIKPFLARKLKSKTRGSL